MTSLVLYLLVGYVLYRIRWQEGFLPAVPDPVRERTLRIGRRRVDPLPDEEEEGEDGNELDHEEELR